MINPTHSPSIRPVDATNIQDLNDKINGVENKAIKSDGLASDYYKIKLPVEILDKFISRSNGKEFYIETNEIIRFGLNNDFDMANCFKCMIRVTSLLNGKGKYGADLQYDANKILWSATEFKNNIQYYIK